jgi:hypothetical protein
LVPHDSSPWFVASKSIAECVESGWRGVHGDITRECGSSCNAGRPRRGLQDCFETAVFGLKNFAYEVPDSGWVIELHFAYRKAVAGLLHETFEESETNFLRRSGITLLPFCLQRSQNGFLLCENSFTLISSTLLCSLSVARLMLLFLGIFVELSSAALLTFLSGKRHSFGVRSKLGR